MERIHSPLFVSMTVQDQPTTEIKKPEEDREQLFLLDDVRVDTLGLVERGAVDETFFLLKNRGEPMADQDANIATVNELNALEQLGAERLQGLIELGKQAELEKAGGKGQKERRQKMLSGGAKRVARSLMDGYGKELPEDLMSMLAALLEHGAGEMGSDESMEKDDNDEVNDIMTQEEVVVKTDQAEAVTEVAKTADQPPLEEPTPSPGPELEQLKARLTKAETTHAAMVERLEKAETELAKAREVARQEREARERIIYIEKARQFEALGVNADQMGGALHRLAAMDETANLEKAADAPDRSDLLGYFSGVLKAASEQIKEAGFFQEMGSSKQPNREMGLVEKAQQAVDEGKYPDLKTALLKASEKESGEYLNRVRH